MKEYVCVCVYIYIPSPYTHIFISTHTNICFHIRGHLEIYTHKEKIVGFIYVCTYTLKPICVYIYVHMDIDGTILRAHARGGDIHIFTHIFFLMCVFVCLYICYMYISVDLYTHIYIGVHVQICAV